MKHHQPHNDSSPPPQRPVDALAESARVDYRLRNTGPYTSADAATLVDELIGYRLAHADDAGRAMTWKRLAETLGLSESALRAIRRSDARTGWQQELARIDQFLADEKARGIRDHVGTFASIRVARAIWGAIRAAIKLNSVAAIIGDPGVGKTAAAKAFVLDHSGAVYTRVNSGSGHARGLSALLCSAIGINAARTHRQRVDDLLRYARRTRALVLIVDESQHLQADGLELLRDLHDVAAEDGPGGTPIALLGDNDFLSLVVRGREGEASRVKAQLARRIYPVLNIAQALGGHDGGGLYTAAEIAAALSNSRVRLVDESGVRWLCRLANVPHRGAIGFAVAVVRMACDLSGDRPLGARHLRNAMGLLLGPELQDLVNVETSEPREAIA